MGLQNTVKNKICLTKPEATIKCLRSEISTEIYKTTIMEEGTSLENQDER